MVDTAKEFASIREAIFNNNRAKCRTKIIDFFGSQIELKQPTIGSILTTRSEAESTQAYVIRCLLDLAFEPGTDKKVFESTDSDSLLSLPFGRDFQAVSRAMEELTDVNFQQAKEG